MIFINSMFLDQLLVFIMFFWYTNVPPDSPEKVDGRLWSLHHNANVYLTALCCHCLGWQSFWEITKSSQAGYVFPSRSVVVDQKSPRKHRREKEKDWQYRDRCHTRSAGSLQFHQKNVNCFSVCVCFCVVLFLIVIVESC